MAEETNVVAETVEQPAAAAASPAAKPKKAAKATTPKAAKSSAVKRTRPAADKKVASPAKAVAAAPKPKKVVKSAAGSAAHPPYLEMVTQAVIALKERKGSSRQAILKYILANFQVIYFYYYIFNNNYLTIVCFEIN
jgi:histone H1/5